MTTMELNKRDNVALKTDKGEVAKGWISGIERDREDGNMVYTVTFHQDKFNEAASTSLVGREFYRQALINAMEAADA